MKFRFYSKLDQKFLPAEHFAITGDGKIIDLSNYYLSAWEVEVDVIAQQCINIKEHYPDGKDIYEGDIVVGIDLNELAKVTAVVDLNLPFGILYIKASDWTQWLKDENESWSNAKIYSLAQEHNFKVIGNIFENPELLLTT